MYTSSWKVNKWMLTCTTSIPRPQRDSLDTWSNGPWVRSQVRRIAFSLSRSVTARSTLRGARHRSVLVVHSPHSIRLLLRTHPSPQSQRVTSHKKCQADFIGKNCNGHHTMTDLGLVMTAAPTGAATGLQQIPYNPAYEHQHQLDTQQQ